MSGPAPLSVAQAQKALVDAVRREWTGVSIEDVQRLERQASIAKGVARQLWNLLSVKVQHMMLDDLLDYEGRAVVDPAFDATLRLWEREHIFVEPTLDERFVLHWPGGVTRVIDRAQLMMLAGFE